MKNNYLILILLLVFIPLANYAQLEKVIVETYYISDANDATDTIGGYLAPGSTTYRVYIDMAVGSKLIKIYGDTNHILKFESSQPFFNHLTDGKSFGKDFPKNRLGEGTVALDTWLTLGQTSRNAANTYFGILKSSDTDGSFIGGSNNDGGSAMIASGLISNIDPLAGTPVTLSDGMDTLAGNNIPVNWGDYGIYDSQTQTDSTIFGSTVSGNLFISYNAGLFNSGVYGVFSDTNHVLIAQLTTSGQLAFEFNVEIIDLNGDTLVYVANDSILINNEIPNSYLTYPYEAICGCPDASYIEYLAIRDCDDMSLCNSLVAFGCMDSLACNYDVNANYHIQDLCCYPGRCFDRDLDVVCPEFSNGRVVPEIAIFPNPANDMISLNIGESAGNYTINIYNSYGKEVYRSTSTAALINLDVSNYDKGLYIVQVNNDSILKRITFLKY